ncbi:hypothetical protein FOCC_FOCC017549 [Frankliniella occidentalis]|nr:hypothetical protein FOCC_FOCC017549 [Frankliniella occidentalis]
MEPVSVQWLRVRSEVQLRFSHTLVRAALHNPASRAQEVQLRLTLPDTGYVTGMSIESDGKAYKAYVRERRRADGEYQQAALSGQTAAQVRQSSARDSSVMSLAVTVAARSALTVNLTYEELLGRRRGRYHHALGIDPGQEVNDVRVDVFILESRNLSSLQVCAAGKPLYSNYSSGPLVVRRGAANMAHIQLTANREQQLQLWQPAGGAPQLRNAHLALQTAHPQAALTVAYDVDRSKSEWSPHTLEVVGLRDKEATLPANKDHINKAKKFINNMEASGGTNIGGALRSAVRLAGKRDYDRWPTYRSGAADRPQPLIVFLTDGLPTVGTLSLGRVLAQTRAQNVEIKAAIFSLSFGSRSNWRFLQRLSLQNDGFARRIYEAGDAAQQLQDFYQEIASPLLANVTFNYVAAKVDGNTVTRRSFPLLYSGGELVVAGRVADGVSSLEAEVEVWGAAPGASAAVGAAPGRRLLRAQAHAARADIVGLKPPPLPNKKKGDTKYGFVTRVTSLVVVKPELAANGSASVREAPLRPLPADGGAERDAENLAGNNKYSERSTEADVRRLQPVPREVVQTACQLRAACRCSQLHGVQGLLLPAGDVRWRVLYFVSARKINSQIFIGGRMLNLERYTSASPVRQEFLG